MELFKGIVFLLFGVLIVFFSEPFFDFNPWQKYGFGSLLIVYAFFKFWRWHKSK